MGKKSLIKSTSKKKATAKDEAKKSTTAKKSAAKSTSAKGAKKTTKAPKATTTKKTTPKKAKAPAKKTTAKAKATSAKKKAPAQKTAAKTTKKKTTAKTTKKTDRRQDLLRRIYLQPVTGDLYTPEKPAPDAASIEAPPLVAAKTKKETDRIRKLLFRTYDMAEVKKAKAAPKKKAAAPKKTPPKAAAKKKPTLKELLARRYEARFEVAPAPPRAGVDAEAVAAPALISAGSEADAKRLRDLLLQSYSIADLKAAAKKAAAEKAAAEKAAAEKAAEPAPAASVSYTPPPPQKPADPVERAMKFAAAGLGLLIFLIVAASISNTGNYYLKDADGGIEIWQGRFAPLGEKHLLTLPGVTAPDEIKEVYTQKEVFPLAFNYYLDKADTLLKAPGLPDFDGIKAYAAEAKKYAIDKDARAQAQIRSDKIDWMILVYKADMAVSRGSLEDLEAAREYLEDADRYSADELDEDIIANKLAEVEAATSAEKARLEEEAAAAAAAEEKAAQVAEKEAAKAEAAAEGEAVEGEGAAESDEGSEKAAPEATVEEAAPSDEKAAAAEGEGH